MSLPPLPISACTTALAFCRVPSLALSNIWAVPRPTAGRGSPLAGIARVISGVEGCANAVVAAATQTGKTSNSRRVSLVISLSRYCARLHEFGAPLLRPSQSHRQDQPHGRNRCGDKGDRAELQAQGLQRVEHPTVQSIGAAIDDHVDQVLGFVFFFPL